MTRSSRRDFLKMMALASASLAARPLASLLNHQPDPSLPHVIVFVFDAWSAAHMKMYNYPRTTMPNLERFADRCLVYHNHYSAGNFTVPGTASLLTGLQPWEHRALQLTAVGVEPTHLSHSIFHALSNTHEGAGYAQNPFADIFLYQFRRDLANYIPQGLFNIESSHVSNLPLFQNDYRIAFASFENNILNLGGGASGSLFGGLVARYGSLSRYEALQQEFHRQYPVGLPLAGGPFLLEAVANGLVESIRQFTSPTLAYFHVFPPHAPYAPKRDFRDMFEDGWLPPQKPIHPLSLARVSAEEALQKRQRYDQYLAAWDAEFARVLAYLTDSGMLDKSIIIFTSDHGELFERGEIEHNTPLLSRPVVHVPLLISLPRQTQRKDIHAFTSSVDLLPSIAHLIGSESPAWGEGRILPELGGEEDANRSIFSMDAKRASSFAAIRQFSISIVKERHRLIYYQYPDYSGFEFYDMENDPEELTDLYLSGTSLGIRMQEELTQKVEDFNRPYQK